MGQKLPSIKKRTIGVLYVDGPGPNPATIEYDGIEYFRFHDFIYVSTRVEELDEKQVIAVCTLRDEFATPKQLEPNRKIREKFIELVRVLTPNVLLELGPGIHPLFEVGKESFRYEVLDLNEDHVQRLAAIGYRATLFRDHSSLDIESGSVDLVVAVFVFQFCIAASQIDELLRTLTRTGLMVANVYRRSPDAREQLRRQFEGRGFDVRISRRAHGVEHNHEYWIVGRNLDDVRCNAAMTVLEGS